MPSFCRHGRFIENCPICSKKERARAATPAVGRPARRESTPGTATPRRRSPRAAGDLTVRRMARAADDGYEHELVPGLRGSADAVRLAEELAFSVARLEELALAPPAGPLADAAAGDDVEEGLWSCFLVAYLSPADDLDEPFEPIARVRTSWASGELPRLDDVALGARTAHDPARGDATVTAYRTWAQRAGSQAAALRGEAGWDPARRFDRAFERLGLPGFHRSHRIEFLVLASRLGLVELDPWSLKYATDIHDPVLVAAKRVFGIGDPILLGRRTHLLAETADVPVAAFDLALFNFGRPPGDRYRAGSRVDPDAAVEARVRDVLGVPADEPDDDAPDAA